MILKLQFRENVAAWICFYDRKDMFKSFLERVLRLKEVHFPCTLHFFFLIPETFSLQLLNVLSFASHLKCIEKTVVNLCFLVLL